MGKGVTPLSFRLGHSRIWDKLFTNSFFVKNYNLFYKSQLLSFYVDGFFKKWTWNKRRSFYLNYLYSHVEVGWSFNYFNMVVYFYMTAFDLLEFKLKRNFYFFYKKNKNFVKFKNRIFFRNLLTYFNYHSLIFKRNQGFNIKRKKFNEKNFLKKFVYLKKKNKEQFYLCLSLYIDLKWSFQNRKYLKNFFFSFLKKRMINRFYGKNKLTNVMKFGYYLEYLKMHSLGKKGLPLTILFKYFIFLNNLVKVGLYKSYINFIYYYFAMKPFQNIFKRHFFKDMYYLLGLNKLKNIKERINISFIRLQYTAVTASCYGLHIWLKLKKKYSFGSIIYGLLKKVKRGKFFQGLLFFCNGRFTRKQKAWHKKYSYGKMPFSNQYAFIDNTMISVVMRYGIGTVKININYV